MPRKPAPAPAPALRQNRPRDGRDASGRFLPGISGNPGGKPTATREARRLAEEFTPEAITLLIGMARNQRLAPTTRLGALSELLDRGLGKPRQAIEVTHDETHTEEYRIVLDVLADPEAVRLADALAARVAYDAGRPGAPPDGRPVGASAAPGAPRAVARRRGDGAPAPAPRRDAAPARQE